VCEAFLPFFYLKIIKGRPAQKTMWVFIIFIVLVAQLLLRTDAIPYRPIFIYMRLNDDVDSTVAATTAGLCACKGGGGG